MSDSAFGGIRCSLPLPLACYVGVEKSKSITISRAKGDTKLINFLKIIDLWAICGNF